jgi:hypothetical protein
MSKTPDFSNNKTFGDIISEQRRPHALPETGWNNVGPSEDHGVNFEAGWDNSGVTSVPASWYLSAGGEVRLRGKITGGDVGTTIFTLPEEVRPEFTERYIVPMEDDIHLENIHFRAFGGGTGIPDIPTANHYLAIYGDRYNGLPGLFNVFSDGTQEDVWLRMTWLNSIIGRREVFIATLVFDEWITDVYYSGDPITIWGTNAIGITVNFKNNWLSLSEDFSSQIINDSGASDSSRVASGSGIGTDPVIDLHVFRTGLNANRGGDWSSEVYVDGTLRFTSNHASYGDVGHNLGRTGMGGIVFGSQYANYDSPSYIPIDNVMVGTTQGGSDLMAVADFESGYSPLDDSLDGSPPTFDILPH